MKITINLNAKSLKKLSAAALGLLLVMPVAFNNKAKADLSTDTVGVYEAKTVSDFYNPACTYLSDPSGFLYSEVISRDGVTMVRAAGYPTIADEFSSNTATSARWVSGIYNSTSTYTGVHTNGTLQINNSESVYYFRNNMNAMYTPFFHVKALIPSVDNISLGYANDKDMSSFAGYTSTNGELFARYVLNGTVIVNQSLGNGYFSTNHVFSIKRGVKDDGFIPFAWYIDDILVALTTTNNGNTPLKAIMANKSASPTAVLEIDWFDHGGINGGYRSCSIDSGSSDTVWGVLTQTSFDVSREQNSIRIYTQTSNDNINWSVYERAFNNEKVPSPKGRYLKYRIDFDGNSSTPPLPYLSAIKIPYIKTSSANTKILLQQTVEQFNQTCAQRSNTKVLSTNAIINQPTNGSSGTDHYTVHRGALGLNTAFNYDNFFRDDFEVPTLDAKWTKGAYTTGAIYNPTIANGKIVVGGSNGGYIISNETFHKRTLEFRSDFTIFDEKQYVGFADSKDHSTFIGFTTEGDKGLAIKVNNDVFILGSVNPGIRVYDRDQLHKYKIEWGDSIKFYIDDILYKTVNQNITDNLKILVSSNSWNLRNGTYYGEFDMEYIGLNDPIVPATEYISCSLDSAVSDTLWGAISYNSTNPTNATTLKVATRTSNDGTTWSAWADETAEHKVSSGTGRYLQYKVYLTGSYTNVTATMSDIMISYQTP